MGDIKLLDCTLRDGGYVNDWEFGHDNIVSIFERLVDANVDMIELGFLDDRRQFDMNRTIMPDTECMRKIFGTLDRKQAMLVGMIDYGTCSIEHIQPCSESYLDGIRVIFKKHIRREAIAYCKQLKDLGYKVFVQLVSITSYSDKELLDLIDLANELEPYAVSMVDTYGLLHQDSLMHYFEILNHNLLPGIGLGYHSHNNFQLGYANCIEMLSHKVDRMVLVDATLYGMGKSAGNTPIELLAMHMNERYDKQYQISQFLEAIDSNIMNFYRATPWGYTMFFYIAASKDCHPSYVSYLMDKGTLSLKSINEILEKLEGDKKLLYDQQLIEELYLDYQKIDVNDEKDIEELKKVFAGKEVVLVGPGPSVELESDKIVAYQKDGDKLVVSVNYLPDVVRADYMFLSNAKRYVQMATALLNANEETKIIATSNVTKTSGSFDYTLRYSDLLDEKAEIVDNSLIMLLKVMRSLGVRKVGLAGFDGYKEEKNYINPNMEYIFNKEKAKKLNAYVSEVITSMKNDFAIEVITDTLYEI